MIHRFRIGEMRATVVSDGKLVLPAAAEIFPATDAAVLASLLAAAGQRKDLVRLEQNCLVVESAGKRALFDNGMGSSKLFGPESGQLLAGLHKAGIDPASVDVLVLTHAHSDHCWGTIGADGRPNFPNAEMRIAAAEYRFWEAAPAAQGRDAIAGFRRHVAALRDRIRFVGDGQEIIPGVHAWATPGHTPGHMAYLFDPGNGAPWCLTGDVAFLDPLSYALPDAANAYDADHAQAAATRRRVLDGLAAERMPVIGYHHAWPGLGRVERHGGAYRFLPDGGLS